MLAGEIERDVPEAVDPEDERADALLPDVRLRHVEPHERVGIDRGAELADRDPEREMSGRRREEVAPVERP